MIAYKKYVTIKDPKQLVLSDLPFQSGQRVEVVLIAEEDQPADRVREMQSLLKTTQALPQARVITESEIASEISAYRAGR
jgi:hypothetical protein